ncbi:MAG: tetratricopeptide repeat protein [Thiohalomonadales bacterium]
MTLSKRSGSSQGSDRYLSDSLAIVLLLFLAFLGQLLIGCTTTPTNTLGSLKVLEITISKDDRIDSARDKAMASYWEFMNSAPEDSSRVEALRRLADLELERSEENYQKRLEKFNANNQEFDTVDAAKLKGLSYSKAIKLYEDAIKLASNTGKRIDSQVLYQLSNAYEQIGAVDKSLATLDQLLLQYPDLENRDEIYFRRGELLFTQKKYNEADMAYTQVMVIGPSSSYFEKAMSKRGWAAYKKGDYSKALYSFLNIIDRLIREQNSAIDMEDKNLSRSDKGLLQDTLRVIALSFSELGGPTAIDTYFSKNGHRFYEYRFYLALGELYVSQERTKDAVASFKRFSFRYPNSPRAPVFDIKAMDAVIAGGFSKLLIKEKIEFSKRYKVNGAYWVKQNESVRKQLLPILEKNVEEVAKHFHSVAQKQQTNAAYTRAQNWYKHFLSSFKYSTRSQRINFLLAEALFENGQYGESAKEYEKSAYQYVKNGKDAEAGYAALLAYGKQSESLQGIEKKVWDRAAVASALRFGKTFPQDKRASTVLTKVAEDLFAEKKYDQAALAASSILELQSKLSQSMRLTAWLIIAQAKLQLGEYVKAESAYNFAKTQTKDKQQLAIIVDGLAATIYQRGDQLRSRGEFKAATVQFNRVAVVAPSSQFNVSAQFDIAAALLGDKKWQAAISAFLKFRREHPNHRLEKQVSTNLATAYLQVKDDLKAADEFEYLIHYEKNLDKKRSMAWQIAQIYTEAGRNDKVVEMYQYYLLHFPEPLEESQEVRNKLAVLYKQTGEEKKYYDLLRKIVRTDELGNKNDNARSKFLAANAALVLAEPMRDMYKEIELIAPLKQNLKIKKRFMKAAVEAYTTVANYGVSNVTTAAYYSLAQIYSDFSQDLMNSERPKGLSSDELEQYTILLEEQAYPFEEKSIDIHETNAALAKSGTYDSWVKKSFVALQKLNPVRYAKPERSDLIAGIVQ